MYSDYGEAEAARAKLVPPNKAICLKCHAQAPTEEEVRHRDDCQRRESPTGYLVAVPVAEDGSTRWVGLSGKPVKSKRRARVFRPRSAAEEVARRFVGATVVENPLSW